MRRNNAAVESGVLLSRTVDRLQKQLQENIFHYAQDSKKAAGRALGTLVEIVTYYKICAWGFSKNTLIEKPIPEFGRSDVRHNVEFSLHNLRKETMVRLPRNGKAVKAEALGVASGAEVTRTTAELLSSKSLLRNSAVIGEHDGHVSVANLIALEPEHLKILVAELDLTPAAIFECKRVGVEEGMKKGPQSIEKAKQGAYVARSVSALQKVIDRKGEVLGFLPSQDGAPQIGNYSDMLADIVAGTLKAADGFVLTVGVVSNHGNWFTESNMNKELKVLAAAYDWLLFLTDEGLMDFVETCILTPDIGCEPISKAFHDSYTGAKGKNRFTKATLDLEADQALRRYFATHSDRSDGWFNILTPAGQSLNTLSNQLSALLSKQRILT